MATMTKIRDLQAGDLVDLSPSLREIEMNGMKVDHQAFHALDYELAIVAQAPHTEPPMTMGDYQDCLAFGEPEVSVFGVEDYGVWALPADLEVPVHGRLDVAA